MANEKNLIPIKKGEVRNPKGRPKGTKNRATVAKELLNFVTKNKNVLDPLDPNTEFTQEELMTAALIKRAIDEGDVSAYRAVMDSAFGTPKQTVENTIVNDTPPVITFIKKKK